jgi:hypothetical protein
VNPYQEQDFSARLDRLAMLVRALKALYRGRTDAEIRKAEEKLKRILEE